ncbi:MAG: hypothetical protein EXR72_18105 [Myxococcales bacterium]|nr:hypothetical protein [Myxococcales bacterium]
MNQLRILISAFALLLAACGSTPAPLDCPPCGAGTHCDDATLTCVADASDDGGMADLAMGGCSPSCNGLTPHCNATNHCVGCVDDTHCPLGSYCKVSGDAIAICTPGCSDAKRCPMGSLCCSGSCAAVASDPQNCGACGTACKGAHSQVACAAGKCTLSGKCDAGWGDCNANPADGCETNLHIDPNHCTMCGMKCAIPNAINACADGCYAAACLFGFDACNNDEMDGCEASVLSDGDNCGGCGKSCKKLPNAEAGCMNGACTLGKCTAGFADCNGIAADGCEAQIAYDAKNCGKCGALCPMNAPSCNMGVCGQGADYGPMHTFAGMTTDHYITQGGCSIAGGDTAKDSDYFCKHFYLPNCVAMPGYKTMMTPMPTYPKMHKNGGCTGNGSDIPGKTCDGGPCKIGNWSENTTGLVGLICHCP